MAGNEVMESRLGSAEEGGRCGPPAPCHREAFYRALIDNSSDIVCLLDAVGGILFINRAVQSVLGYEPTDVVGRSAFEFVHPDDLAKTCHTLESLARNPLHRVALQARWRHRGGSWRHLGWIAQRSPDPLMAGCIVVNGRDLTEGLPAEESPRNSARGRLCPA